MERKLLVPGLVLAVGIVVLLIGLAQAASDTVNCGGQPMSPGDRCVPLGMHGNRSPTTFEQELASKHRIGWTIAAVGGLMSGGSGFLLYWRTSLGPRRDERIARNRSDFATAQGWTYQRLNPSLLQSWYANERLLVTDPAAWNVHSGSANGWRFSVFDGEVDGTRHTMCEVGRTQRHVPGREVPPDRATSREEEGDRRGRPLHAGHHLAPAL